MQLPSCLELQRSCRACLILVVAVSIGSLAGCEGSQSIGQKPSIPVAATESNRSSQLDVTPAEHWQWLIESVTNGRLSSIAMELPVTTPMLEQLPNATEAIELLLDAGVVDDAGLQIVAERLPELEHLRIRLSPVGDQGAMRFGKLKKLRIINLPQCKITREGIQSWQELPQLNHLRLGGAQIDDAALREIAKLPHLQSLHLIGPKITDEGLLNLAATSKLSSLYLDDCPMQELTWVKLKKVRPDLHVHIDQMHPDR